MKKQQNNSTRAWALQIALSVALLSISAVLVASSFEATPAAPCYGIGVDRLDAFPATRTPGILYPDCSFVPGDPNVFHSAIDCGGPSGFCQLGSYYIGFSYESLPDFQAVFPWVTFVAGPGCGPNTFCEWRVEGCGSNVCAGGMPTPTPIPTPTPTPTPISMQDPCSLYEAESNSNTRTGSAVIQTCPTCSGGAKVGYVGNNSGTLQFNGVTANASGTHVVTIYYTNGDPMRTAYVSVNGGPGTALNFPFTGSFDTVGSIQTTISLNAGSSNTVRFYNPISGNWAPDFDLIGVSCVAAFFTGEIPLGGGWYYLQFPNGTPFGYYNYLADPHFIYHIDLGFEYLFDANDANHGIYFYDFASSSFFYTNPTLFPFLYNFSLDAWLYYLPDFNNPGRYSHDPRWFFNFATGQWITL